MASFRGKPSIQGARDLLQKAESEYRPDHKEALALQAQAGALIALAEQQRIRNILELAMLFPGQAQGLILDGQPVDVTIHPEILKELDLS